jgi:hypothetical protein
LRKDAPREKETREARRGGGAVARGLRGARPGGQLVVAIEAEQEARLAGDRARD